VAFQQKKMSDALNCSLTKLSRLYNATSHNKPPVPTNEVDPELAAINAEDEDWWTPSSVNSKRRLVSRSPKSVTKIIRNLKAQKSRFSELSNMDIDVEVSQTVSPNDTEKASTLTSNNNAVNTNVGNYPARNNKKQDQLSGSQGQLPSHKTPQLWLIPVRI